MNTIFTKKKLGLLKTILFVVMLCNFSSIILMNGQDVFAEDQEYYFDLTILSPSTIWSPFFTTPIGNELPKIGINTTVQFDSWAGIIPRTFGWPGPAPIPVFDEGGYDVLMLGYNLGMDYDYSDLYHPSQFTPAGNNFYMYNNTEMNWAMGNFTNHYTYSSRQPYLDQIQQIMYDDLPAICILNDRALYAHNTNFSGWDGTLWHEFGQPMEEWEMVDDPDFYYATPYDVGSFSLHHAEQLFDLLWLRQIYNGLVDRESGTGLYKPRFASSYTTTDGITWTVNIDPDTKWADGTNFTVDDVIYNYQLVLDSNYNSVHYGEYSYRLNPSNIVKIDNYTVEFTFNSLSHYNEKLLTLELIPKHIWDGIAPGDISSTAASWATSNPERLFGLGPYQLNNYETVTTEIVNLERNLYFTNLSKFVEPSFDEVHFTHYNSKYDVLVDYIAGDMDMLDTHFYYNESEVAPAGQMTELIKILGHDEMAINHNHPIFGTGELCPIAGPESARHVRKAISHMIPRESIVNNNFSTRAAPGIIPMSDAQIGFNTTLTHYEYDLTLALWHMAQAGFTPITETPTAVTGLTINALIGLTILFGFCFMLFSKKRINKK